MISVSLMDNSVRIAVCDDDAGDRDSIIDSIAHFPSKCVVQPYRSADALLNDYRAGTRFDIVFMDIKMEGISGYDAAKQLRTLYEGDSPLIVLTTVTTNYVIVGYKVAWRYVQKPICMEEILDILKDANEHVLKKYLLIHTGSDTVKVRVSDILYIESVNKYLSVVTKTGTLMTRLTLDEMASRLPQSMFSSPRRSYIVNLSHIVCFSDKTKKAIYLSNGCEITVSRTHRDYFFSCFVACLGNGLYD